MAEEYQKLSEGFDFIEESTPFSCTPLDFHEVNDVVISESNGEKSPYKILGRVCGCFAPVAAYSRNKRIYEADHWDYVLQDLNLQERLKNRRIFGELGHENKKIDDSSNRAGQISHIVTKMEVREDSKGTPFLYGEFEILDTPAGRILEAMYKGGAGLFVSSRAAGKLKPMPENPGMNIVSKENYYLHSWDVVLEPGFLAAKPVYEEVSGTNRDLTIQESIPPVNPPEGANNNSKPNTNVDTKKKHKDDDTFNKILQDKMNEDSEIQALSSKIEKLAKIIEKVVDDVYEEEPVEEATNMEKDKNRKEALGESQAALISTLAILSESGLSEEKLVEVLDLIKKGINNEV